MTTQYLDLLRRIRREGTKHDDRTGTGTTRIFGHQMRFDLNEGFPLLTTKKMWWKGIVEELLWMLSGSTNNKDLQTRGIHIWDEWATAEQCARFDREEGDLGPVYGHQWRRFGQMNYRTGWNAFGNGWAQPLIRGELAAEFRVGGFDQISHVLKLIAENPNSRRIILTGWNPIDAERVALPPCHMMTQFSVIDGKLSAQMYQRSADVFLGVPFNIASYALLTHLLAHVCGLGVGEFIHVFGDVHIYSNHEAQVNEQLSRTPRPLPKLVLSDPSGNRRRDAHDPDPRLSYLLAYRQKDIELEGYLPYPAIKAEVSV